jgi:Tfp pilus assembly PilM family ATPase
MKPARYLGISFLDGKLQCVEIEHGKKVTVTALAETHSEFSLSTFGKDNQIDEQQLKMMSRELITVIRKLKLTAEYISFAVPTSTVFINLIPLDMSLGTAEVTKYIQWEFSQYHPDVDPKDMVFDYHTLPAMNDEAHQTFIAAIPRSLVKSLQKLAALVKLKLCIVDIDQFSAEKTLLINYPEIASHDIALVGIHKGQVDASLIHNGEMSDYRLFALQPDELPTKVIREYLQYIKSKFNSKPEALLLHGSQFSPNYVVVLRNETGIEQTVALNSLRKLRRADSLPPELVKDNHRFVSAIGVALRTR